MPNLGNKCKKKLEECIVYATCNMREVRFKTKCRKKHIRLYTRKIGKRFTSNQRENTSSIAEQKLPNLLKKLYISFFRGLQYRSISCNAPCIHQRYDRHGILKILFESVPTTAQKFFRCHKSNCKQNLSCEI